MSVGFTGTRKGLTSAQHAEVRQMLRLFFSEFGPEFHEGECDGADLEAKQIAIEEGYTPVPHPAGDDPLGRDRDIVDNSEVMLGAPGNYHNLYRGSGTWYTIRYANKTKTIGFTIWPDGRVTPMTITNREESS